jgi:hypothetical protein
MALPLTKQRQLIRALPDSKKVQLYKLALQAQRQGGRGQSGEGLKSIFGKARKVLGSKLSKQIGSTVLKEIVVPVAREGLKLAVRRYAGGGLGLAGGGLRLAGGGKRGMRKPVVRKAPAKKPVRKSAAKKKAPKRK